MVFQDASVFSFVSPNLKLQVLHTIGNNEFFRILWRGGGGGGWGGGRSIDLACSITQFLTISAIRSGFFGRESYMCRSRIEVKSGIFPFSRMEKYFFGASAARIEASLFSRPIANPIGDDLSVSQR